MRSRWAKFKQLRHFAACALSVAVLAGCAAAPAARPGARAADGQPLTRLVVPTSDADHDLLAQLLSAEMAMAHNDLKAAATAYGKAMNLTADPQVAGRAAALAIAVRDFPAAERGIARWQAVGGKPAQLAEARAQLAVGRGDTDEARRQLLILVGTRDPEAWRQFGRVLVGARDQAQAGQLLTDVATPQRLPADPQVWLAMSELGDKLGRSAYAQQLAEAALRRFKTADTYAWAAQMRFKVGDQAQGRALFKQALAKDPKNLRLRLAYASLLSQSGDYAGATSLLDSGPQNNDTYALRTALAVHANDSKALARIYQQLQQAPQQVRDASSYLLGQLAEMLGRKDEALDWYDQVGDDDPHAFDADLRSAVLLHQQGKNADAHALLEQMQTDYLDQPDQLRRAWEADAELYMSDQQYAQAEDAYTHALLVTPDDPGLLYGRGLAYAEGGKIDQAIDDFRRLLQLKPDDVDASNALGYTLADANRDLPEAEKLITKARAAKPDDPSIADSWGWLQYRLGHFDQAAQALRGAWVAHKDADVGVHLGEVLWKQGRRDEANHIFDEVRKIDPQNSNLRNTLRRLSQ